MSLNNTPSSERIHIGILGKRNAGKSSIVNALTGQSLSIVSEIKGTTTDPVSKAMELLPLGPVVIIDTPGLDDDGELGRLRIQKAYQVLNKTDIALLIVDAALGMTKEDEDILLKIQQKQIPYMIVINKSDLLPSDFSSDNLNTHLLHVSAKTMTGIETLKEQLAALLPKEKKTNCLVSDLISKGTLVVLVVPIDDSAPKGRLILPQQQVIRDILEMGAISVVTKETELRQTLSSLSHPPALVITDSQVFAQVDLDTPGDIYLTSFSILFARYKGILDAAISGAHALATLEDGDTILISEGCTHHRQCEDIGTVKLPRMIDQYTQHFLHYEFTSGTEFPSDLSAYRLIIHCGGCMLNGREINYRIKCAQDAGVPITNYGIAMAHMQGILERSIQVFHTT